MEKKRGPREALQELWVADHAMDYGETPEKVVRFENARAEVDDHVEREGHAEMLRHTRELWPETEKDEVAYNMVGRFDYGAKLDRAREMDSDALWQSIKRADLTMESSVRERNAAIAVMAERSREYADTGRGKDRGRSR